MGYIGNQFSSPVDVGDNAPKDPKNGTVWWNSADGKMYVYYQDADSAQWVQVIPSSGTQGAQGPAGPAGASANLINITSNLVPSANVTYDIGTADNSWKDLYLSGNTIFLGSSQITLNANGGIDLPANSRTGGTAIGTGSGGGASVTSYANTTAFPSSGNSVGDFAFATNTKAVYIWDGSEWDRISAGVDESPVIITEPSTSVSLNANGSPTTVTMVAQDPEGFDITYGISFKTTNNTLPDQLVSTPSINQANGVYTFTPSSNSSLAGTFRARLSASDGVKATTRFVDFDLQFENWILTNISPPLPGGANTWNLDTQGPLTLSSAETYTFKMLQADHAIDVTAYGAGGSGPRYNYSDANGGSGGKAVGRTTIVKDTTHTIVVGGGGINTGSTSGGSQGFGGNGGGTNVYGNAGGGDLTGIFAMSGDYSTLTQSSALIIAGGGGGGGSGTLSGGAGGGTTGNNGEGPNYGAGGTQSAGGAAGAPGSGSNSGNSATAGAALIGGTGGGSGGTYTGAGGGGGYYGGGGADHSSAASISGGGGGSGYLHSSLVTNGTLTTGNDDGTSLESSGSAGAGGSGGGDGAFGTAGKIILSKPAS